MNPCLPQARRPAFPRRVARCAAASLLLLLGVPADGAQASPVAVVVQATRDVRIQSAGADSAAAVQVGAQLRAGDRIIVPRGGQAVVLFATGKLDRIVTTTTLSSRHGGDAPGLFIRTTESLAGAEKAAAAPPKKGGGGTIRPMPGEAVPISPRNGVRIAEARPTFVWHAVRRAAGYRVQLQRAGEPPVRYAAGPDTVWTLPADLPALEPGAAYDWTVVPGEDGRVAAPQRFRVLSREEAAAVAARLREIVEAGLDPERDGLFLAALAYHDAGLLYDAAHALDRIEASGAATGPVFHRLRAVVYAALGRADEARRELERAGGGR